MAYQSTTIADAIAKLNVNYFLPAIQRPYVWEPSNLLGLFDSLLRGHPISALLFWNVSAENRSKWDIYKFSEHFQQGAVCNVHAEPEGRDVTLVLDGQQRLTSLLIGLQGSYALRPKYGRKIAHQTWPRQRLWFDLFKDPAEIDGENPTELRYGLKFMERDEPSNDGRHLWIKPGIILDCPAESDLDALKERVIDSLPDTVLPRQRRIAERNLDRLYATVWKDHTICFYTERSQNPDDVLQIFIRANSGGEPLSKSDLLLSMLTSQWEGGRAREEIHGFVDYLNRDIARANSFGKDLVMRSTLVVTDLPHVYNVANFTVDNMAIIRREWPRTRGAIEAAVRLINRFGIDRDTLTSMNAVIPIIYYFSKLEGRKLDGSSPFEAANRERIRRWLLGSLLNNVFGGNSDQTVGVCRDVIRRATADSLDFPFGELVEALYKRRGRVLSFDDANISNLLTTTYKSRTCYLSLSLLYDQHVWSETTYHIDHIIPQAACSDRALQAKGVPAARIEAIKLALNSIGNLALLPDRENGEKSSMEFRDWVRTREGSFLDRHLIPEDEGLWHADRLVEFVEARKLLIVAKLRRFLNVEGGSEGKLSAAA